MTNARIKSVYANKFRVDEKKKIDLKQFATDEKDKPVTKLKGRELLQADVKQLSELQERLYASNRVSVLIVLQAMDAAGKDGAIKHVMSGLNPQGVRVTSFKTPTHEESEHDFLWRHYNALPERGMVGIFNRSHYENVLVTKVHPEYMLNTGLPGIHAAEDFDKNFWEKRYKQINDFEKTLIANGTIILKFFLHVSKKEQKKRFLERINDQRKNWKFSTADVKERQLWKAYRKAYEEMFEHTSSHAAPWFIIPADDKWFTSLAVANIIVSELSKLDLSYPILSAEQKTDLENAKALLQSEK